MCVADYQIARQLAYKSHVSSTTVQLDNNPRRVGVLVCAPALGSEPRVFLGTDSSGPCLVHWVTNGGGTGHGLLHLRDVGIIVTEPLFCDEPGGLGLTVVEIISSAPLEQILQGR